MNREELLNELKIIKDYAEDIYLDKKWSRLNQFECFCSYKLLESVIDEIENDWYTEITDEILEWLCRNNQWIKGLYSDLYDEW